MRILRFILVLCGVLACSPPYAAEDAAKPWLQLVRSRVAGALASTRRSPDSGIVRIGFAVAATGRLLAIHAEGPPDAARRAAAALHALRRVPPPPDHRSHVVTLRLNIQ